jgi:hypothetical protein
MTRHVISKEMNQPRNVAGFRGGFDGLTNRRHGINWHRRERRDGQGNSSATVVVALKLWIRAYVHDFLPSEVRTAVTAGTMPDRLTPRWGSDA